jgi:hypothetical protein
VDGNDEMVGAISMNLLQNFPMVSQRTPYTGDGKPSNNAMMDCVAASVDALCRYALGKTQDSVFNPDDFKDRAYSEAYTGPTAASQYVAFCKSLGVDLHSGECADPVQLVKEAHAFIAKGTPVLFTELDPYVDTNLPQFQNWTHVCVWYGEDGGGLTAMDPWLGGPVYKGDATWASVLRSNQYWIAERISPPQPKGVPEGWHDDGETLTAPNGIVVVRGFREWVLSHQWDKDNYPLMPEYYLDRLEESNPALGGGSQQIFRWAMLGATNSRGVFVEWIGTELVKARQMEANWAKYAQEIEALLKQSISIL